MTMISVRTDIKHAQAALKAASAKPDTSGLKLPAGFEDAYAKMMLAAANSAEFKSRQRSDRTPPTPYAKPSKGQEPALLTLKGVMSTTVIAKEIGHKNAAGFLSGLCGKGLVERCGTEGQTTLWKRTRKGRKWVERNRGSGK